MVAYLQETKQMHAFYELHIVENDMLQMLRLR